MLVQIHYMTKRGAGMSRSVRTPADLEQIMRSLLRRRIEARATLNGETVGEVDPDGGDDGRGYWWFDNDAFLGKAEAFGEGSEDNGR